jgi:hypothetical protein
MAAALEPEHRRWWQHEDRRDGDSDNDSSGAPLPRGLDSVVLAVIPVVVADVGMGNGRDCTVCLAELELEEL